MNTTTKIILILVIVLGAGVGAYFLLKPKESSAGGHAGAGGSAGAGGVDNDLAGYPATTDNTPETGQTGKTTAFPYHLVGYEIRIAEGTSDMTTLPFDKTTTSFPHQNGVIPVTNGLYNVGWGLDMAVAGDGIEWRLDVQGTVKSGKFLFKDMTDGKKASDWGYASVGWGLIAGRVTWTLTIWVE